MGGRGNLDLKAPFISPKWSLCIQAFVSVIMSILYCAMHYGSEVTKQIFYILYFMQSSTNFLLPMIHKINYVITLQPELGKIQVIEYLNTK